MRLPRRVPWSTKAELEQLCSWIYADGATPDSRQRALHRLSAWRVATPLPHALDSVLSLLAVELGDQPGVSALVLRQSYASAIVRFVNGMVDPLQFGAYARSIASIAAQIGLPAWLVELRHAATHEDLPSLDTLREASHEAMAWLLQNYFMPVLSMSQSAARPTVQPSSLVPLLQEYKTLAKQAARDASLRTSLQADFTRVFRQLERWIGEAKVAFLNATDGPDDAEASALELLSSALLDKGALVPLTKKKRLPIDNRMLPPNAELWQPLLGHLQETHSSFGSVLLSSITSHVGGSDSAEFDSTVRSCLLSWVVWIVDTWGEAASCGAQDAISHLLLSLQVSSVADNTEPFIQLVEILLRDDDSLKARFIALLRPTEPQVRSAEWQDTDVHVMKQRLSTLQQTVPNAHDDKAASASMDGTGTTNASIVAPGWRSLAGESLWRPCPIGTSGTVS